MMQRNFLWKGKETSKPSHQMEDLLRPNKRGGLALREIIKEYNIFG